MTRVEMDLERDLFTVTATKERPSEAEMIAAVGAAGFKAAVERPGEPAAPASESALPQAGAMPPLVQKALDRAGRDGKLVLVDRKLAGCCAGRGSDEASLRAAGVGTPR